MHSNMSVDEGPPVACSQDTDNVFWNSNLINRSSHVMNLLRKYQRPKISPLLPNPAYLPALYQSSCHYSHVNWNGTPQILHQPMEKIIDQQSYQRNHHVNFSFCRVIDTKTSTSPTHKSCYFDSQPTKTNLLKSITNIDGKITKIEFELVERKKFEASKNKPSVKQLKQVSHPINNILFQKILTENQQKALESHNCIQNLAPQLDFPVYKQPCDTAVYHENKKRFISFKDKLMMLLRKKYIARVKAQKSLLKLYSQLAFKWKNNVNKVENSRRHKSKEVKSRNYFETIFPELQKKKLISERSKRTGDHVLSEADYQDILRRLEFENLEDTLLKSSSAHPSLLLDFEQRSKFFLNQNNLISDVKVMGEDFFNLWAPAEKLIFKEKFIQFPKDFVRIASFLDKKSVSDCVKYYYLTKKRENYKISTKPKKLKHVMFQEFRVANEKVFLSFKVFFYSHLILVTNIKCNLQLQLLSSNISKEK